MSPIDEIRDVDSLLLAVGWLEARVAELEAQNAALAAALAPFREAVAEYGRQIAGGVGILSWEQSAKVAGAYWYTKFLPLLDKHFPGWKYRTGAPLDPQAILATHDAALTERVRRETLEQCEIMCCGTCGGTGHEERGWQGNVECSACDGSGAVVALRTIKREFSKEGK